MPLELLQVPVLRDNTTWLVKNGNRAFVVDPPVSDVILTTLANHALTLDAIVLTHHHPDHIGGVDEIRAHTNCRVIGHALDRQRLPTLTDSVHIGDRVNVVDTELTVVDVRAHTLGHIAYVQRDPVSTVWRHGHGGIPTVVERLAHHRPAFVGDSLFLGGCGRLFEGTKHDLARAFAQLACLDDDTLVCCAHEYTASNLKFAASILPDNVAIHDRITALDDEMGASRSSLPDSLARERHTNLYLMALDDDHRCTLARVLGVDDNVDDVVGALRARKDTFKVAPLPNAID